MSDKKALGRGLSALLSGIDLGDEGALYPAADAAPARQAEQSLPLDVLHPGGEQPRKVFNAAALEELALSIRAQGIIQPLIVRPLAGRAGHYQIVAGERRWRAAQAAGQHEAPVIIRDLSDGEALQIAIIENIQRADLNPIEEAMGFRALIDRFGHTQEKLAESLGKSRSHIANGLRLLTLPERIQDYLITGALTAGHARACLAASDPAALGIRIVENNLSVREAERLARESHVDYPGKGKRPRASKDADTVTLEQDLTRHLGIKVSIDHQPSGGGELRLKYRNLEELDGLIQLLSQ